ncbi:SNF2 helicase associated domain-containing protein [Carnobacterium gallinarum]|uniref:DEAD/DEAH box helicase n=1 Tax=Carnobacterium gallinarum TaxID=2749 RepID=UPI0005583F87|nr:DEAD/DEAH box helicase [Carnobacterium gallinarum]
MKWSIPERIIDRGRVYVAEKRVLSITPFLEKKIWTAEVMGSEIYHVELDGTTRESDFCECTYWKDHGYCKHTVAVELALKEQGVSRIMTVENAEKMAAVLPDPGQELTESFTRVFLNENRESFLTTEEKSELLLEYKIEIKPTSNSLIRNNDEVLALSLRAGADKLYIVKNIMEFFESYSNQGSFNLNPSQLLDFKQTQLSEADRLILNFLQKQAASNEMMGVGNKDAKSIYNNDRYLVIAPILAEETIQLIQETGKLQFFVGESKYKQMLFVEEQLPISFELFQQKGKVFLYINNQMTTHLKAYQWFISKHAIFQPSKEQLRAFQPLQNFLQRYDGTEVAIDPVNMPDFTAYVLPLLAKIGDVSIDDTIQDAFIQEPLKAKIYFTYQKDAVHATVDFNYKHLVLSTNEAHNQLGEDNIQVIRDSQKELKILNSLKQFDYHRDETSYAKRMVRDEDFYTLFTKEIPFLELDAEVYVDDLLDSMFLDQIDPETSIDVQNEGTLLDVKFDIKGITPDEVDQVLKSLIEKRSFHKLDNGVLLSLETEAFQQVSEVLAELRVTKDFHNGTITLPSYRGLEIQETIGLEESNKRKLSRKFKNLIEDLSNPEDFEATIPKGLHADLRPYQVTGYKWLKMLAKYGFGGILADDMGLGKTIQVITFILSEVEENGTNAPFLIVSPASLTYNWHHEIKKFAPQLESFVITGSAEERQKMIEEAGSNQILITSYPSFRQDVESYKKQKFSTLVLDESQMVKNYHTKTAQALRELTIRKRFALSGTPIENKIEELWAIFQLIMPGFFPAMKQFKTLPYEQIARMIRSFVLRRIKKDVLKELPDKIETDLYSSMTKEQKTVYLAYLQRIQDSVRQMSGDDFKRNRIEILAGLTRLRQICCDPRLFIDNYEGDSGKLEQLKERLQTAKENGQRVLLFSQFTSMLAIIEKELASEGIETFYLSGQTKPKERIEMVNRFNEGEKEVFLISLKAGGTGLNLTGADTVILYDLWWNPAVEEQAAGRAHRLGQKKVVQVWRLIAEGTIEEKISQLQQEKKALFDQVITSEGNDPKQLTQLTEADIREILNIGD